MNAVQKRIHDDSIKLLQTTGYRVIDERILKKLSDNGIRVEGTTVHFTEEQIMDAINAAPSSFKLNARNPKKSMVIGEGETKVGSGYGCVFVVERDGSRRDALFSDYINFAKLAHQSECMDINGGILVQPYDLDTKVCYPTMLYATMSLSDLPLLAYSAHEQQVRDGMELCEIAFGGSEKFRSEYNVLSLVNLLTPLQLGDYAEQTLWVCAEYNQPVIMSPGLNSGGTAPVTVAGALVVANADMLAGITVAQNLRRGMPVVYGINGAQIDMATGNYIQASPFCDQMRTFARSMAKAYNMPSRNGGGLNDAKKVGIHSTFDAVMSISNSIRQNTSISLHSAGILDSFMSMSYEKYMIDCEAIKVVRKSMEEIEFDEDIIDLDNIAEVGIGGNNLSTLHTVQYFRDYTWDYPFTKPTDQTKDDPKNSDVLYMDRVQALCKKWLETHECPPLENGMKEKLEEFLLNKIGVEQKVIDQIFA